MLQKIFDSLSLGLEFDPIVLQVAHPAPDTQMMGPFSDVPAKTDSLDVAGNESVHGFHSMITLSLWLRPKVSG